MRGLAGLFDSFLDGYVEQLYAHLVAHPVTASFLTDGDLVACLNKCRNGISRAWSGPDWTRTMSSTGSGSGRSMPMSAWSPRGSFGAYNQYLQYAFRQFAAHCGGDLECYVEGTLALLKLLLLDMGLALDRYFARSTEHLRTALRLLAQSNAELKEFADLASHDLKTPLATVANLCEEFLDEFGPQVPAEGRGLIEAARSKTLKLGRMIGRVAGDQRGRQQTQTNHRVPVATRPLLDQVLERLRPEVEGRSIQISVPDYLPEVHAHPGRLSEVFYHVLSNAVDSWTTRPVRSGSASKLQKASTSSASVTTDPASRRLTCRGRSSPRSGACPSIGTSPDQAWVCTS